MHNARHEEKPMILSAAISLGVNTFKTTQIHSQEALVTLAGMSSKWPKTIDNIYK